MQIQIGNAVILFAGLFTVTTAFPGNFLREEIYLNGPHRQGSEGSSRDSLNIDNYGFSKTLRELSDAIKKSVKNIQKGSSTIKPVPQELNAGVSKRPTDHVNIGTGQTVNILRPTAEPNEVGFHAALKKSQKLNRINGQIIFDTILESIPDTQLGYYNNANGVFTCPVSGTYMVSLSIASGRSESPLFVSVYVNRYTKKMSVVSDGRNGFSQGSVTGFIKLRRGDQLSVMSDRPSEVEVLGAKLSSWSVYLLNKY